MPFFYFLRRLCNDQAPLIQLLYISSQKNMQAKHSSVIRQKSKSQNECFKKTKHVKFSKKRTFPTHWYAHVRSFFEKFDVLCFLETAVLRFALLPYYQRIVLDNCMRWNIASLLQVHLTKQMLKKLYRKLMFSLWITMSKNW